MTTYFDAEAAETLGRQLNNKTRAQAVGSNLETYRANHETTNGYKEGIQFAYSSHLQMANQTEIPQNGKRAECGTICHPH